ncbi:ABC transporter substrate-binding protein [Morganella psychrotolerans]|uniref:ABC transporter permease n=1 Tax=Morganella psychrotolerans TaxID=368603 RepID=A0A1B8HPL1_9GAMM|nr:ABC transporter substrate-binding protein [Morganella psychrotolerans]OBU11220.1 ABC transporter permease [Morganella psychrotolerans]
MRNLFLIITLSMALCHALPAFCITAPLYTPVTLHEKPQRIVTIFSSNTEITAILGLSDNIVGIDAYTYFPDEIKNKPLIGGRLGFSLERIIEQKPDLVIMTPARQATHQLLIPLQKFGIPVLVLEGNSIEEIISNIRLVAKVTKTTEKGEQIAVEMERRLSNVQHKPADYHAPRVIMITGQISNGLLLVARPQTYKKTPGYTADSILKAGGTLALEEYKHGGPVLKQISPEAIIAADPDILLYTITDAKMASLLALPGWSQIKAVKNSDIYPVKSAFVLIPGPRIIDGIEYMSELFEQWSTKQ